MDSKGERTCSTEVTDIAGKHGLTLAEHGLLRVLFLALRFCHVAEVWEKRVEYEYNVGVDSVDTQAS